MIEGIIVLIIGYDNILIVGFFGLVFLWFIFVLGIKCFYDCDKFGWWVLIGLIFIIGFIWILIEFGFLEGIKGLN